MRTRPFLRSKHNVGTFFTQQRIIYIAEDSDLAGMYFRVKSRKINGPELDQISCQINNSSFFIEEAGTECPKNAHASVYCGAATNTENDFANMFVQSLYDQLTRTKTTGKHRIPLFRFQESQTG